MADDKEKGCLAHFFDWLAVQITAMVILPPVVLFWTLWLCKPVFRANVDYLINHPIEQVKEPSHASE